MSAFTTNFVALFIQTPINLPHKLWSNKTSPMNYVCIEDIYKNCRTAADVYGSKLPT